MAENSKKTNVYEIAVIGSGLAGLSVSNLLSKGGHNVTILEKAHSIGMDMASVSVPDVNGIDIRIDSPMRGITQAYYATVFQLYRYLGIPLRPSNVDASFMRWRGNSPDNLSNNNPVFFTTNFKRMNSQNGTVAPSNTASYLSRAKPSLALFPVLLRDILFSNSTSSIPLSSSVEMIRLYLHALHLTYTKGLANVKETLEKWLDIHHFSKDFQTLYLVPFLAGMGTCSKSQIFDYPASTVLHMLSKWGDDTYQVDGGVRNVCTKLLEPVAEVVFNCEIAGVWKDSSGKILVLDSTGYKRYFDKVIFAGSAYTGRSILMAPPPSYLTAVKPDEHVLDALSKFSFIPVRVIVHTDASIMPRDRKEWRGINLAIDEKLDSMATLWVNYMQNITATDYFETSSIFVSPEPVIAQSKRISEHVFPRSLVTRETNIGIDQLELVQGINDIYFVGAWTWPGMPLLEGCVASAVRVSERLGIARPWTPQGGESKEWSPQDDELERGLVDRFLNGDLCADSQDDDRGFIGFVFTLLLIYLQLNLFILTRTLGLRKALLLAYRPHVRNANQETHDLQMHPLSDVGASPTRSKKE